MRKLLALALTILAAGLPLVQAHAQLALQPDLRLQILDGKAQMAAVPLSSDAGGSEAPGNLRAAFLKTQTAGAAVWQVNLTDLSGQNRWLELSLDGTSPVSDGARYSDGFKTLDVSSLPYEEPGWTNTLPLAAIWGKTGGMAIGLEPHQAVSYLQHTAQVANGQITMSMHVRIVVEPGATRTLSLISFPISGKWGYEEALERFYALAPDLYDMNPNVDPRIFMPSTAYGAWDGDTVDAEPLRRSYARWEWAYAPFKRTGDIAVRSEFFDYIPARGVLESRPSYKNIPFDDLEKYHAWRKAKFERGERAGVAMMFYVPAQTWCEERLAREKYPDSITDDPAQKCYFNTPWCTGWDNELRMLPWNDSFGEESMQDMSDVAEELNLTGFAFDTADGGARYFGPAVSKFPERAWDAKLGEYVEESIAVDKLAAYVHTLHNSRGNALGVIANHLIPFYVSAWHSDAALHEASPWTSSRWRIDLVRHAMGRKPAVWWNGYALYALVDYEHMTAAQMADAYLGAGDYVISESFRKAFLPMIMYSCGVANVYRALPSIIDFVQAGWEPVPAATVQDAPWITRYGNGLQTRLAVGNETLQASSPKVEVDDNWIGGGSYLFSEWSGGAVDNAFAPGITAISGLQVGPRKVGLLQARAVVKPALKSGSARATYTEDLNQALLTISFAQPLAAATVSVPVPAQTTLASAQLNGKKAAAKVNGGRVDITIPARASGELKIVFVSQRYGLTQGELDSFPFTAQETPQATIVLRPGASDQEKLAAQRLVDYFHYYYAHALDKAYDVTLAVAEGMSGVKGPIVLIDGSGGQFSRSVLGSVPAGNQRVGLSGDRLYVVGKDPQAAYDAVWDLTYKLDRKYSYPGPLPWLVNNHAVGIVGKWVDTDGSIHGVAAE